MSRSDNAEAMRIRAHQIWEREGRPQGREHQHWAEAARELEVEAEIEEPDQDAVGDPENQEIERLRKALYQPDAFSEELFGEAPATSMPSAEELEPAKPVKRRRTACVT